MVPWYTLVSSDTSGKHIVHVIQNGGHEQTIRYVSVRAGVSYPSEIAPGAFCVVGQEMDDKLETGPSLLTLLDEWEYSGLSVDNFWNKVTDSLVLNAVSPLYLDERVQYEANLRAFQDYCDRMHLKIDFAFAPWSDNFFTGLSTANDWLSTGRLDLDKSSRTREQLKSITRDDLLDSPETKYPLVNALRHVLSGFRKYPPMKPLIPGKYTGYSREGGWMV
jgi:hypothetical protein